MKPCIGGKLTIPGIGIQEICPPLAKRSDFKDGTHNLADCLEMHLAIDESIDRFKRSLNG